MITLVDLIFAAAALAGLAAFLYIIVSFVPEPTLIGLVAISLAMAIFDLLRDIARDARSRRNAGDRDGADTDKR
ncbi:MAG: hypothetical protein AAF677_08555 [Pseudomonadota bacterium]